MFCRTITHLAHVPPERCVEFYRTDNRDIEFDTRKHRGRPATSESQLFYYYQANGELLSTTIPWQPWTDEDVICPPTNAADALARVKAYDRDPVQRLGDYAIFERNSSIRSTSSYPQVLCIAHVTDSARSCFQLDFLFFEPGNQTIRPGTSIVAPAAWTGMVFAKRIIPIKPVLSDTTVFEAQSSNGDLLYLQIDNRFAEVALPEWEPSFQEHHPHVSLSRVNSRPTDSIFAIKQNNGEPPSEGQALHLEPSRTHSRTAVISQDNEGPAVASVQITATQPVKHLALCEGAQQSGALTRDIDVKEYTEDYIRQELNIPADAPLNLDCFTDPPVGLRPMPMATLLKLALCGSNGRKMTTDDLCRALVDRFAWFKEHEAEEGWKSTLRVTLAGHPEFVKMGVDGPMKRRRGRPCLRETVQEYYWTLDYQIRKGKGKREKDNGKANGKRRRGPKEDGAHHA